MQRISRVQEMNSSTLRDYSRAPGRTAPEKAGAKQELLAVVRSETIDLTENRLTRWCLQRIQEMARGYCKRNEAFRQSSRYRSVVRLAKVSESICENDSFTRVGPLPIHLSRPTYCLHFEPRYRCVWKAYLKIRRQQRIMDDAWRWHFRLWGTSARQMLTAILMATDGWSETRSSTPYFRSEGEYGEWIAGPSTPGPFKTPQGVCHLVDLRDDQAADAIAALALPDETLQTGADWILSFPSLHTITPVWAAVAASGVTGPAEFRDLNSRFRRLSKQSPWKWSGLIMLAEPEAELGSIEWITQDDAVCVVRVPSNPHACWEDLKAGVELALEAARAA